MPTDPPTDKPHSPSVRKATLEYLEGSGDHDSSEDMHPASLDPVEGRLHDAMARRREQREQEPR